jgi:aspartyl-tRNA(Asn)/glutamyl-tRNA(Gln) amidotransferase subunit C
MSLSLDEVRHIADLARLRLSEGELETYREQLSSILDHVASLQKLDTSGISPTSSVLAPQTVLRSDDPRPGLPLDQILLNAPDTEDGQFRVPPVLE